MLIKDESAAIKMIEDFSLNAWPSHQIQYYDGWLLRFSYFYTHRTNSVEQLGHSVLPIDEKIDFCEDAYHHWGTPCIFKITPLLDNDFEKRLINRGYLTQHITEVMLLDFNMYRRSDPPVFVLLEHTINSRWINGLFALKGTTSAIHRQIVPSMYRAIPKRTIAAHIEQPLFKMTRDRLWQSVLGFLTAPIWESMRFMYILITEAEDMHGLCVPRC